MGMMQKIAISIVAVLSCLSLLFVVGSLPVLAAGGNAFNGINCRGAAAKSPVCGANGSDPLAGKNGVIVRATRLVAIVAGFASVVIIIIGGINFTLSGGDSSKTTSARNTIINAAVGLVIIVLAQAIITFVVSRV